ncbi:cyclin-dependent kinase inhibitor 7-like isoform X1 [Rhodamnia argentea]|uniref:Cyclin-dependent kinase inhibitor 7-like isoform X1 n=1 Tax=Rhodamnia argentea TaxID=178133 RepID=A0ABM3HDC8_9MYRT|nr:cyclin-dependent kinase inhibitor 7-like isoform X1 [Rhodamnia argentea]
MEDHRSTRQLTEASSPTASKRGRLAFVLGELFELRPEEREGEPPLLLPCKDSSEKISVPSESGEIVSRDFASSSSSGPLETPRSSARSDEESSDIVKEKFDVVVADQQQQVQAKSFETEASTCNSYFSRETTPSSHVAAKSVSERRPPAADMPSRAELESFFSAAETREQQRFTEKYNYDVVMDVPLEGRYGWIPKP